MAEARGFRAWTRSPRWGWRNWGWLERLDWFRGLRAAAAVCAPLLLGDTLVHQSMAWASLGGFEAIIADNGGPYRERVKSIGLLAFGGALGCVVGSFAGAHLWTAVAATAVFCFCFSFLPVLGGPFTSANIVIQVIYFCALGGPAPSWHAALYRAGTLLLGAGWAALLSLFLWPIDPYRPARRSLSDAFLGLSGFLEAIEDLYRRRVHEPEDWHRAAREHQGGVRKLMEASRVAVSSTRARTPARTVRGRNLVVLLETADMLMARTITLSELLEPAHQHGPGPEEASACVQAGMASLELVLVAEQWIAAALRRRPTKMEESKGALQQRLREAPPRLAHWLSPEDVLGSHYLYQLTDMMQTLEIALDSAAAVWSGSDPMQAQRQAQPSAAPEEINAPAASSWWETLRANWNGDSLQWRHALRMMFVGSVDVGILHWFRISHGYWLPLTSIIVLQPHVSATVRKSLQRVGGTIAGGVLAAVLALFLHTQTETALIALPLSALTLAVMPVSYSWYCFFLTPTFVLLALPHVGDWQLALVRAATTFAGAALALAAMALLWPAWERQRFAPLLERGVEADAAYLDALLAAWRQPAGSAAAQSALAAARRRAGLAINDAEESLDRLILEASVPGSGISRGANRGTKRGTGAVAEEDASSATAHALAFVAYLRRLAQSVTTLASYPFEAQWRTSPEVQRRLRAVRAGLGALASGLTGSPLPAIPDDPVAGAGPQPNPEMRLNPQMRLNPEMHSGERQLMRMERQLRVLRSALVGMQRAGLGLGLERERDRGQSREE